VERVDQITFSAASAHERGRSVLYVTERAVFSLNDEGLVLTEIAPGVDLERDVLDQAGGTIRVSPSLKPMCPAIFQPKPMGLATREPWTKEQVA
jgi:propionate CoA-transferase